jgi:phenylacetate-coenzyme A ligase PaaK-like adenylate-forming protein
MNLNKTLLNFHTFFELRRLSSAYPFDKKKIEQLQLKKLRKILIHAHNNFEFYRDRMDCCGLDPHSLHEISEIQKIPPLTEAEYRSYADYEYEQNPDRYRSYFFDQTSGTTGIPFRIVRTWPERAYMIAKYMRSLVLNGLRWDDHSLRILSPRRIKTKKDSLLQHLGIYRRTLLSMNSTAAEMAEVYLDCQPDFFYANKHQLLMTAHFLLEHDLPFKTPRIYSAGADIIEENCLRLFHSAFGSGNFFETYGSNEIGTLAFQIKGTEGLHFCHDTDILELQSREGSVRQDEGNCLITDLGIYSFPLIRFQLGDYLETYEDERGIRKIRKIWGRLHDWIPWDDGSRSEFSIFFKVMEKFSLDICQFQIIQETYDHIRILAVPGAGGKNIEESRKALLKTKIIASLKKHVRASIDYQVDFVPLIPAGKNGKVKMIISKVKL